MNEPITEQENTMRMKSRLLFRSIGGAAPLAVTISIVFLSACATSQKPTKAEVASAKLDDLGAMVRAVVTEEARAARVIALLDEIQGVVTAQGEALAVHDERIRVLLSDYTTTDQALRTEFPSFIAGRNERAHRAVKIAQQVRAAMTPEEWADLDKARKKAFGAVTDAAREN